MAAEEAQVIDPQEFVPLCDYDFTGDNRTVENKRTFVEWYRRKASIYHAAAAARVARSTVYKWMDNDPQFVQAMEDSFEDAADVMETSTYEDALGTPEKQGNALLKMFWLKAHRPKYRDRVAIDVDIIKNEIAERMQSLGLKQLPPIATQFIEVEAQSVETPQPLTAESVRSSDSLNITQFSSPSDESQKESSLESEHNPALED